MTTTDSGSGRADARANRLRVIAAARTVFRERGLDAEMREIAERAGVGFGTLYRNFPTRDGLVGAVAGEMVERMRVVTEAASAIDDPLQAIEHFIRGGIATVEEYGDLMEIVHHGMPESCRAAFAEIDPLLRLAAVVQRGIDQGCFRADLDVRLVVTRIISTFIPGFYTWLRLDHTPDQIADGVLATLFDGIRRR